MIVVSRHLSSPLNVKIRYGIATEQSRIASMIAIADEYPRFSTFALLNTYTLSV